MAAALYEIKYVLIRSKTKNALLYIIQHGRGLQCGFPQQ